MFAFRAGLLLIGLGSVLRVSAETYDASGTFYNVAENTGACGQMHSNEEYVVALGHGIFDTYPGATSDPNDNPICKKKLKATYEDKSVVVQVVDRCAGCAGKYDTDFSPTAFTVLAKEVIGRIDLTWEWTTLPLGPVTADNSSSTDERRSVTFGRRKPLDSAPAKLMGRAGVASVPRTTEGSQPPKRRYRTEAERRAVESGRTSAESPKKLTPLNTTSTLPSH